MEALTILLGGGTLLTFVLLVLLVVLIGKRNGHSKPERKKVSSDLKKIKDQINGE
jgi:hypothetical protein